MEFDPQRANTRIIALSAALIRPYIQVLKSCIFTWVEGRKLVSLVITLSGHPFRHLYKRYYYSVTLVEDDISRLILEAHARAACIQLSMQASKSSKQQMQHLLAFIKAKKALEKSHLSCSNFLSISMHYEYSMSWLPLP